VKMLAAAQPAAGWRYYLSAAAMWRQCGGGGPANPVTGGNVKRGGCGVARSRRGNVAGAYCGQSQLAFFNLSTSIFVNPSKRGYGGQSLSYYRGGRRHQLT